MGFKGGQLALCQPLSWRLPRHATRPQYLETLIEDICDSEPHRELRGTSLRCKSTPIDHDIHTRLLERDLAGPSNAASLRVVLVLKLWREHPLRRLGVEITLPRHRIHLETTFDNNSHPKLAVQPSPRQPEAKETITAELRHHPSL